MIIITHKWYLLKMCLSGEFRALFVVSLIRFFDISEWKEAEIIILFMQSVSECSDIHKTYTQSVKNVISNRRILLSRILS